MDLERSLHQISRAYTSSAFADAVLMALAKASRCRSLSDKDLDAIDKAIQFLQQAKEGYSWIEEPEISDNSVKCATSFEAAVKSFPAAKVMRFVSSIEDMMATVRRVRSGGTVPAADLERVRDFFSRMLRSEMTDFNQLVCRNPTGRVGGWALATHLLP